MNVRRIILGGLLLKNKTGLTRINLAKPKLNLFRKLSQKVSKATNMAPVSPMTFDLNGIQKIIKENDHVMFSLTYCPFCKKAKELFKSKSIQPVIIEVDESDHSDSIRTVLYGLTGQRTFPSIFAFGNHMGGSDDVHELEKKQLFDKALNVYKERKQLETSGATFDYEAAVIGGGSGGIAFAKELASSGKKVVLFDYVVPSPLNTKWGLGGTCVNVGCIPKKLMHQTAIHHENIKKSQSYGFEVDAAAVKHNWFKMMETINNYVKSLNFNYRKEMNSKGIKYINGLARITAKHEITYVDSNKKEAKVTSKYIVVATGERPQYPGIPGEMSCITSDDLFWLKYQPGKTLIVGASYVALECAGALHGMGYNVTVMVRSIFLRGYDQEMANKIGDYMAAIGVKFMIPCIPVEVTQVRFPDIEKGEPGLYKVKFKNPDKDEIHEEEYNTVMFAVGRASCTKGIGLETVGVSLDSKNRVVSVDNREQTECSNVFALGDILANKPQLTPVAIKAGTLLAQRLSGQSYENCNYNVVPTTVFTPLEYGAVGYSEEDAIAKFGQDDIDVYFNVFEPLEDSVVEDSLHDFYYAKLVCRVSQNNKVIGVHILSPNAGEIVQGYAVAVNTGATLMDFNKTFGIHPTVSEVFTSMKITKRSGKTIVSSGC